MAKIFSLSFSLVIGVWACGDSENTGPRGLCETSGDDAPALWIQATYPTAIEKDCEGALSELRLFVLVQSQTCELEVLESGAEGCCHGVEAGSITDLTLTYQKKPGYTLGIESQRVTLPKGFTFKEVSFPGEDLSASTFDSDGDGKSNLEEFCEGSL